MPTVTVKKTEDYLVIKIPLKAAERGEASISNKSQKIIDAAISEGLKDIKSGNVFGPFKSVKEFKKAINKA